MGQPYDIPNMMVVSRIVRWNVVLTYAFIAWACSVTFGLLYGTAIGGSIKSFRIIVSEKQPTNMIRVSLCLVKQFKPLSNT